MCLCPIIIIIIDHIWIIFLIIYYTHRLFSLYILCNWLALTFLAYIKSIGIHNKLYGTYILRYRTHIGRCEYVYIRRKSKFLKLFRQNSKVFLISIPTVSDTQCVHQCYHYDVYSLNIFIWQCDQPPPRVRDPPLMRLVASSAFGDYF